MKNLWQDNGVQFSRLLSEIAMMGLTQVQVRGLKDSMDLTEDEINELFVRAVREFEVVKREFCVV